MRDIIDPFAKIDKALVSNPIIPLIISNLTKPIWLELPLHFTLCFIACSSNPNLGQPREELA